ncbi:PAS domain-containing protein [Hydrogenimonas sp.]|uniref:PAS domain-containing protein n=1 Tax=Hydrogenimonas sp. TaxID=2231112 RepID=UPI0026111B82|nr:PAS domain-containing protein [Hydrogenimonas sp.]
MIVGPEEIPYLLVILDDRATIVDIDITLENVQYEPTELIGKNWFEIFIDTAYEETIKKVFEEVLAGSGSYTTFENDILCKDGTHKYIDFHNTVFEKDGKKFVKSIGIEHYNNAHGVLSKVVDYLENR